MLFSMKKIIFSLAFIIGSFIVVGCADHDKFIKIEQMPVTAQNFIQQHFPGIEVSYVKQDHDSYEVRFSNGYEVDFDRKGEWDNVDCNQQAVPASIVALLPAGILQYVATNFPNTSICQIDKERNQYDIELTNGLELTFNAEGRFLRMDD